MLILLFIGVFMGSLDIGIVGPALPGIQTYFGVNERAVSWIFTIYILFFMIGTPLMAKLSDIYGRKSIYILGVFIFAVGSLITVTSFSFEMLLLGRAVQGIGAGGIFPVANAFIGDTFPPESRGSALGILSSVWGLSGVLGPVLGGLLLSYGWQWLFIINLPIAAAVIIGSSKILPKTARNGDIKFDWYGITVLSILIAALAYGVNQINTTNVMGSLTSISVLPFLLTAVILLPVLWKVEKNAADPVIQVDLFRSREVKLVTSISIGTGLSQAATVFVPALAVVALSLNTSQASLMVIPLVLAMAVGAPIIGKLLDKFGSRNIMFIGTFILVIGLFLIGLFANSFYLFIFAGILMGIGMSTDIGSPPRYIMLVESPPKERAAGQALININTSAGQLIGGALIGAVIGSLGGRIGGYESAYILIAFVAIVMVIMTIGLKNKKEQLETMKRNFDTK